MSELKEAKLTNHMALNTEDFADKQELMKLNVEELADRYIYRMNQIRNNFIWFCLLIIIIGLLLGYIIGRY